MNEDQDPSSDPVKGRRSAEAEMKPHPVLIPPLPSVTEALHVIDGLRVRQLELELQNQTLRETGQHLERRLKCCTDLYHFAPVGYAALTRDGVIREMNLAGAVLLGLERAQLIDQPLGGFISADTRSTFKAFLEQVLGGMAEASGEVSLALDGQSPRPIRLEGIGVVSDQDARCHIALLDITDRQQAEEDLRRSLEQYRAVIETAPDGFWMMDAQGRLLEVNETYARLSGYSPAELRSMSIFELEANSPPAVIRAHLDQIRREGYDRFETAHRMKNGRVWPAEINACYWPSAGHRFFVFIHDICGRQRSEMLLKIRLRLAQIAVTGTLRHLVQAALDEAEHLTHSAIGFFHFVEPDQEHLTLQTWSSHTLATCQAPGEGQHYPVSQAGVWVDGLRQRRPVIHNDYASLPDPHGLPQGHVRLVRELTLPILAEGQVVAIIGVGNKPEDYTDEDVVVMQQLTDLMMDVIERKRTQDQMEHLAYYDALTQLPNRVLLGDRMQRAMAQTRCDHQRLAVCYLDLDDFKPINDTYGHGPGDQVLIEVARRLKECVRAGDTVARLGGDEFVLLLGELATVAECECAIDRVLTALHLPFTIAGQPARLSASLGLTLYPDDAVDADTLLRHVDQAMYLAKQAGGRRYQWFDADQDRSAREYRLLLQRIGDGLDVGEFCLYYQPKVDMRRGGVVGAAALMRWQHPVEGLLPPARFIPLIDASERAGVFGHWVLKEALRQMTVWTAHGLHLPVSVNLSGRHLLQPDFIAQLRTLLAAYPTVPPHDLELEILETATLDNMTVVSALIADCQALGVSFALDDFGTGYSSLTYLKHLPVDLLKIDQSFVRDLLTDTEALAIVQGVIGLSLAFRRGVIAEGVETVEQGRRLLELGCDFAQGYGIARPMPPEQIPDWIAGWTAPVEWTVQ
jgi:diguanylate cyclase (GGDEF)-like protein/PAS domain S-box-containing protein